MNLKYSGAVLSETELKLLDYIKSKVGNITIELIKTELGENYLGALGKLIQRGLIEKLKKIIYEDPLNKYGRKYVKCYMIKREE